MTEAMKSIKINRLLKRILIWRSKLSFKPHLFSFAEKIAQAENVLICLPGKQESFELAKDHLTIFADIFQNKKISVFLPFAGAESLLSHLERYVVIYPQKEDLGIFSLPRREFIQRIKDHRFEIALDLDLEDGFVNSYLCLKSGAFVRIGLEGKAGFPFYNLQLTPSKERLSLEDLYVGMAETLKKLSPEFTVGGKENRHVN
jgi:hypothetical protein